MQTRELQAGLVNWSLKYSGHEDHRQYIGLSGIGDCERVIYDRVRTGRKVHVPEHMLTRLSYELEAALVARIKGMGYFGPGETISLYNGLVQGHTDGVIDRTDLLEIKTIPLEKWLPVEDKIPGRIYWQVQAYLHYTKRKWAHVVFLARDTGIIAVHGVPYRASMGAKVEEKVARMVEAVLHVERPACTCGRCAAEPTSTDNTNYQP